MKKLVKTPACRLKTNLVGTIGRNISIIPIGVH